MHGGGSQVKKVCPTCANKKRGTGGEGSIHVAPHTHTYRVLSGNGDDDYPMDGKLSYETRYVRANCLRTHSRACFREMALMSSLHPRRKFKDDYGSFVGVLWRQLLTPQPLHLAEQMERFEAADFYQLMVWHVFRGPESGRERRLESLDLSEANRDIIQPEYRMKDARVCQLVTGLLHYLQELLPSTGYVPKKKKRKSKKRKGTDRALLFDEDGFDM